MMKVAINTCYGGFGISDAAFEKYLEIKGITYYKSEPDEIWGNSYYYSVPVDEYTKQYEQDKKKGNYSETNKLSINKYDIERNDPVLIQIIEEMGKDSWGPYAQLSIVEIPDDVDFVVEEYDGREWVAETHRTWS